MAIEGGVWRLNGFAPFGNRFAESNQTVPIKAAVPAEVLVMINSGKIGKYMFGLDYDEP